jgi:NADP-dependent 3-hydroxy acid dehydrogenase YdfG
VGLEGQPPRPFAVKGARVVLPARRQDELAFMTLRKHIYDFVTNPLFESLGVVDLEQGIKAGRDLDRIIELSESITKSEDKPKKPTKP